MQRWDPVDPKSGTARHTLEDTSSMLQRANPNHNCQKLQIKNQSGLEICAAAPLCSTPQSAEKFPCIFEPVDM